MATIWRETADGFAPQLLDEFGGANPGEANSVGENQGAFRIVTFQDGAARAYALLGALDAPARVNGHRVAAGIRVLRHQDEIAIGSARMFFSAESTPRVEVYMRDGSSRGHRCPICRNDVLDGQTIVRCPGCGRVYHQIAATETAPEKPCWTYSPCCKFCKHPTSLSGEPSWNPNEEF